MPHGAAFDFSLHFADETCQKKKKRTRTAVPNQPPLALRVGSPAAGVADGSE